MSKIEQSKNWNEVNEMKPAEVRERYFRKINRAGFPYYLNRYYELIMSDGNRQKKCYVDNSQQYQADGSCWRDERGQYVERYNVVAWKEVE